VSGPSRSAPLAGHVAPTFDVSVDTAVPE
jgi:hypothetical protein